MGSARKYPIKIANGMTKDVANKVPKNGLLLGNINAIHHIGHSIQIGMGDGISIRAGSGFFSVTFTCSM